MKTVAVLTVNEWDGREWLETILGVMEVSLAQRYCEERNDSSSNFYSPFYEYKKFRFNKADGEIF